MSEITAEIISCEKIVSHHTVSQAAIIQFICHILCSQEVLMLNQFRGEITTKHQGPFPFIFR